MKKKLWQYCVLLHKYTEKTSGDDGPKRVYLDTEMIIKPDNMLAKTMEEVAFKVTRMIPDEHASNPEDVEIIVQGF